MSGDDHVIDDLVVEKFKMFTDADNVVVVSMEYECDPGDEMRLVLGDTDVLEDVDLMSRMQLAQRSIENLPVTGPDPVPGSGDMLDYYRKARVDSEIKVLAHVRRRVDAAIAHLEMARSDLEVEYVGECG